MTDSIAVCFHLPNVLAGQALAPTLIQVGYAFCMGCAFSVAMRLARSILLPVAMHALWDFSTFTSKSKPPGTALALASFAMLLVIVILIAVVVAWCFRKKRQIVPT